MKMFKITPKRKNKKTKEICKSLERYFSNSKIRIEIEKEMETRWASWLFYGVVVLQDGKCVYPPTKILRE